MAPDLAAEVERQIDLLAIAIVNSISNFNPAEVILGGFVGAFRDYQQDLLEKAVERESMREPEARATLVRATLRERRLMLGGAELAFAPVLRDPAGWRSAHLPAT
jgi:predicted NBD/HSP70 family sugar kinase